MAVKAVSPKPKTPTKEEAMLEWAKFLYELYKKEPKSKPKELTAEEL